MLLIGDLERWGVLDLEGLSDAKLLEVDLLLLGDGEGDLVDITESLLVEEREVWRGVKNWVILLKDSCILLITLELDNIESNAGIDIVEGLTASDDFEDTGEEIGLLFFLKNWLKAEP